jgi:hypothetical protein
MDHYSKFLRYGSWRRIWLCAMGHCAERNHTVKLFDDFCALGHGAGFGYALWATAQSSFLSAMGHNEAFG